MAKQEVGRAAKSDVAQKDAAELLKKKVQQQEAEAEAAAADVSEEAVAEEVAVAEQAPVLEAAPAADVAPAAMFAAAEGSGVFGTGLTTGQAVGVGLAVVGGGLLIAEATDDDDDGGGAAVNPVSVKATSDGSTAITSIPEGGQIIYVVQGTPGQVFNYAFSGTGITTGDYTASPASSIVIGTDGFAFITVTVTDDFIPEGNEILTLVGLGSAAGLSVPVTIVDGALEENYILTSGIDNFPTPDRGPIGIVEGIVGAVGPTGTNTFSAGDTLIGNDAGTSVLDLNVVVGGTAAAVEIVNFDKILLNPAAAVTVAFNASQWEDIGQIVLNDGANGASVSITTLETGVDLIVDDGIAGTLGASFTNGLVAFVGNSGVGGASVIHDANGIPDFTVNVANSNTGFMVGASTGSNDITVGDMTGVGGNSVSLFAGVFGSQDITFGNIDLTIGNSGVVTFSAGASGDITGGDISLVAGDNGFGFITVSASTDVALGDISLVVGDGLSGSTATGSITLQAGSFGSGGNLTAGNITLIVGDDGTANFDAIMGVPFTDLTLGNLDFRIGDAVSTTVPFFDVDIQNSSALAGGSITVGDINVEVGFSASMTFDISLTGIGGTTQTGDLGNLTVGNIAIAIGEDAFASLDIDMSQAATTSVAHGMGTYTVGDISVTLGQDASLSIDLDQQLSGTSAGAMGDFTVGNLTANMAIGAFLSYDISVTNSATSASGTAMSIGNVTVGDVTVTADDGAVVTVSIDVIATSGDIGSVVVGDMSFDLGVSASASAFVSAIANNIGSVTIGDLVLNVGPATTGTAFGFASHILVATSGDVGSVSIGDISIAVDTLGSAGYVGVISATDDVGPVSYGNVNIELEASASLTTFFAGIFAGDDIGAVSFGDIALQAHGATASATAFLTVSAGGDIDSVTIGDITLVSDETSAFGVGARVVVAAGAEVGDIDVGDIRMAHTVSATGGVFFTLVQSAATEADINIGLALTASSATTNLFAFNVAANTALTAALTANVVIDNLDVNISATSAAVTGGVFDLGALLGGVLVTTTGNTGNLFLGTVDYADFTVTATATRTHDGTGFNGVIIDGSNFNGDFTVIGSGLDDLIYDNIHSNTLTGGAGADKFLISGGNTGTSQAAADVITDFETDVDTLYIGTTTAFSATSITAPTVGQYSEATYASYAAFLAGAGALASATAAPDFLHAGQVGGDVFVAVDANQDGTVDFVIQLQGVSIGTLDFADFDFNG